MGDRKSVGRCRGLSIIMGSYILTHRRAITIGYGKSSRDWNRGRDYFSYKGRGLRFGGVEAIAPTSKLCDCDGCGHTSSQIESRVS